MKVKLEINDIDMDVDKTLKSLDNIKNDVDDLKKSLRNIFDKLTGE